MVMPNNEKDFGKMEDAREGFTKIAISILHDNKGEMMIMLGEAAKSYLEHNDIKDIQEKQAKVFGDAYVAGIARALYLVSTGQINMEIVHIEKKKGEDKPFRRF